MLRCVIVVVVDTSALSQIEFVCLLLNCMCGFIEVLPVKVVIAIIYCFHPSNCSFLKPVRGNTDDATNMDEDHRGAICVPFSGIGCRTIFGVRKDLLDRGK